MLHIVTARQGPPISRRKSMTTKFVEEVVAELTRVAQSTPSPLEFEMAYQAKVASDRIRFAVRQIDRTQTCSSELRETNLQLLDALDRLESAERKFQQSFRRSAAIEGLRQHREDERSCTSQQARGASV